jgi:LemA protein
MPTYSRSASALVALTLVTGLVGAPLSAHAGDKYNAPKATTQGGVSKIKRWVALGVLGGVMLGGAGTAKWGVSTHNGMIRDAETVSASYSAVDIQLQRRADLIPNLVATVKGYSQLEAGVLEKVAASQAAFMSAGTPEARMGAANGMSAALLPIIQLQQKYPELKSNEQYMKLMQTLKETEDSISIERSRYNDAANAYNTELKIFPGSLVKGSLQPVPYFKADPGAAKAPTIDFNK